MEGCHVVHRRSPTWNSIRRDASPGRDSIGRRYPLTSRTVSSGRRGSLTVTRSLAEVTVPGLRTNCSRMKGAEEFSKPLSQRAQIRNRACAVWSSGSSADVAVAIRWRVSRSSITACQATWAVESTLRHATVSSPRVCGPSPPASMRTAGSSRPSTLPSAPAQRSPTAVRRYPGPASG